MNTYNPGEDILLYARFENDMQNTSFLTIPTVEILYIKDGIAETLLNVQMSTNDFKDFYYNYTLPNNCHLGEYQVIYTGYYQGNENKLFENFFVVNYQSSVNPIRLYGYVHDSRTHEYINNVQVDITNTVDGITYTCNANLIGQWECYIYSGSYRFLFKKNGYKSQEVIAKITDELQQLEFNNILLEKITSDRLGEGLFEIKEQYLLKDGQPIENLQILIYSTKDLVNEIVNTKTNDDGYWYAYLDDGSYLLKAQGTFNGAVYDKTFRLKVRNNGDFDLQDISNNYATDNTIFYNNGEGTFTYVDYLKDKDGKPISDVQVNILNNNDIVYQYYTDTNGKFEFHLDEGTYTFEFYHPSFKTITQKITINNNFRGDE